MLNGTEPAFWGAPVSPVWTTLAPPGLECGGPKCILWSPCLSHVGARRGHLFLVSVNTLVILDGGGARGARVPGWLLGHFVRIGGGERGSLEGASLLSVSTEPF